MWTSGESVCATVQCCGQTASGESRSWTSSILSHTFFRLHTHSPVPGLSPGQVSTILSPHVQFTPYNSQPAQLLHGSRSISRSFSKGMEDSRCGHRVRECV